MRKIAVLVALLAFHQSVPAQYQRSVQVNAAALRTHLRNATDNASDLVSSAPKITPNAGVILSWTDLSKNGFQGWRTGLEYLWYRQKTEGGYLPLTDPNYRPTGFTTSSLHYLSVPMEARFGLAGKRGITPFFTAGGYVSALLTYKETNRQVIYYGITPKQDLVINTEVRGKTLSYDNDGYNSQRGGEVKILKSIYQPMALGLMGSIGFDYETGKNHFFSLRIPVRYGLTDIERKGIRDYTGGYSSSFGYYYWDYNSPKGVPLVDKERRSITHPFSYGLELSYGFIITSKSPSGETTN